MAGSKVTEFEMARTEDILVVRLPNRLDVTNTRAFLELLRTELERGQQRFVLDLGDTMAIDSTALGAMVQVYKVLETSGGCLMLARVGDGVRRVLAITRIDRVFPPHESLEAAVSAARSAA